MVDNIESLPTDSEPMTESEKEVMDTILKKDATKLQKFIYELKLPLIAGILFILINSPQVTDFIKSTVRYAGSSETSMLCFKAVLFMLSIFVYNNIGYIVK